MVDLVSLPSASFSRWLSPVQPCAVGRHCPPRLLGNVVPLTPEAYLRPHSKVNSESLVIAYSSFGAFIIAKNFSQIDLSDSVLTSIYPALTLPVLFLKYEPSYLSYLLKIFFISCLRGGKKSPNSFNLMSQDPP